MTFPVLYNYKPSDHVVQWGMYISIFEKVCEVMYHVVVWMLIKPGLVSTVCGGIYRVVRYCVDSVLSPCSGG